MNKSIQRVNKREALAISGKYIAEHVEIPLCIVECGFLSNEEEEKLLQTEEYQDKIADFFESLTTSKDFILLSDGNWDLKVNHSVKIDIDDIYEESDTEEDVTEDDDLSEEDNYDDDYTDTSDDDLIDDDYSDLTIVDDTELDEES